MNGTRAVVMSVGGGVAKPLSLLGLLVLAGSAVGAEEPTAVGEAGNLRVEVSGFRSDAGQLLLRLYAGASGFPNDGAKAVRQTTHTIKDGRATIELPAVPFGSYAVGCVHDENGNDKLDTNLFGIPKEGVCASNDARGRRGPPKWEDARFDFKASGATLQIHVMYVP